VTARPGDAATAEATAYARKLTIQQAREPVFDAIATPDGLRRWWTTTVTGSAAPGGTLRFGFAGLDEQILMRVDAVRPLSALTWSCVAHPERRMDRQHGAIQTRRPRAAGLQAELPPHRNRPRASRGGMGALPGQPGRLRRARRGQPVRRRPGRPGQTRAGRRQTHRSPTHARQPPADIPVREPHIAAGWRAQPKCSIDHAA
jgi:hypothetical protein